MKKSAKKEAGAFLRKGGAQFRVWAPFASGVAVTGAFNNWTHTEMANEGDGYWYAEVKNAEAGQEYKFVIKNGDRELYKNDPRALQVTTSTGNSVLTEGGFGWEGDHFTAPNFNEQVIYELHIGTFNREDASLPGTFSSAGEKLDYLAALGINMVELMPINVMANDRGWGYASNYIYAVESLYGGRREFQEFVKAAHQKGIGVILDVVYNHFGPDGGLDLWQFDGWSEDGKGGIYFYNDWRSRTPWGDTRPDFGREEVRDYIFDNVRMWMKDCHLDGIRVDSTVYIRNVEGRNDDAQNDLSDGWGLLQQITDVVKKINPRAITIAEDTSGNEYITKPASEGGAGFSAQWEVGFPHVLRHALDVVNDHERNLGEIAGILTQRYNTDAFQRVLYSDSHDTAGNGGARLNEEISPGNATGVFAQRRSLLASAIVLTAPGIPMLFQGQEFLQGGIFNDWQALEWKNADKFHGMVDAHRHLIALRKNIYGHTKGLVSQSVAILHLNEEAKVLAYHRWDQGGPKDDVIVLINFANKVHTNYWINFPRKGVWNVRFNSDWKGYSPNFKDTDSGEVLVESDGGTINIGPYSVLIMSQDAPS